MAATATIRLALACLLVSHSQHAAWAVVDDEETAPEENVDQFRGQIMIADSNFDRWVFGQETAQARQKVLDQLSKEIERLERGFGLTAAQKEKLLLAARGDIKRAFEEVEQSRQHFLAAKHDINEIMQIRSSELEPLRKKFNAGLFGESSMFAKTLPRTLTAEQLANTRPVVIEAALNKMEESVPLRKDQHRAVLKLLLEDTNSQYLPGNYDAIAVVHQLAKLPENKVKPLLDDRQWKGFQQLVFQFHARQTGLQNGIEQGLFRWIGKPQPAPVGIPLNIEVQKR